jgi:hypothetical protein
MQCTNSRTQTERKLDNLVVHDQQGVGALHGCPGSRLADAESVFNEDGDCGDVGWVVLVDLLAVDVHIEDDCLRCLPREGRRDGGDGLLVHSLTGLASVRASESSRLVNIGRYVPVVVLAVVVSSSFVTRKRSAPDARQIFSGRRWLRLHRGRRRYWNVEVSVEVGRDRTLRHLLLLLSHRHPEVPLERRAGFNGRGRSHRWRCDRRSLGRVQEATEEERKGLRTRAQR